MKSIYISKKNMGNKAAVIGMVCGLLLANGIVSYGLVSLGIMPYHLEWFCIFMYLIIAICVSVCLSVTTSEKIIFCRAFKTDLTSRGIKTELSLYTHGIVDFIGFLLCAFIVGLTIKCLSAYIVFIFISTYLMFFSYVRYFLINRKLKKIEELYPTIHKKTSLI